MKVTSTISPMPAREPVRPAGERKSFSVPATETTGTTEPTASVAAKKVPSGLQRVLERLQDMPVASLTKGQANAMQHIERNIARYRDHHGIAAPVTTPAAPVAETPAETPIAAPVVQAPVKTPVTTPETPIAAPVAETPAETPPVPVAATEPAPVEALLDAPTSAPAVPTAAPVATPEPPPLEASLVDSLPPAGSVIDMQA